MKRVTIQNLEMSFNTECLSEDIESFAKAVLENIKHLVSVHGVSLEGDKKQVFTLRVDLIKGAK